MDFILAEHSFVTNTCNVTLPPAASNVIWIVEPGTALPPANTKAARRDRNYEWERNYYPSPDPPPPVDQVPLEETPAWKEFQKWKKSEDAKKKVEKEAETKRPPRKKTIAERILEDDSD